MNILIAYATVEGQTRKIASQLAEIFENRGWQVALQNTAGMMEFILNRPDAAILLAPVHAGRYPTTFTHFVRQEADWLNSVPSALFPSRCRSSATMPMSVRRGKIIRPGCWPKPDGSRWRSTTPVGPCGWRSMTSSSVGWCGVCRAMRRRPIQRETASLPTGQRWNSSPLNSPMRWGDARRDPA